MSKTLFVGFRGSGFWAYDVAVGILLKHVIDVALDHIRQSASGWLLSSIEQWRVNVKDSI
jgi:hypothetical protein